MQIKDRVFLVTGASSGLGAATARMFVDAGAKVVLGDINAQAGAAQADALGDAARFVATDITQEADVQRLVDTAKREFGGLNGVVNCAGLVIGERILGKHGPHRLESFARIVNVNLIGTFNVLRIAASAMAEGAADAEGERGVVVNTASVAAFDGQIGQAAYAASKGGVAALTLPAARELARVGVRVVTIAPGIFETPMMAGMTPEVQAALGASVPFPPRLGRPSEYAALVRHIVENTMINGEVIRLDGALRMAPK
ncbi:SDR family NAD(P)-dependent oxidoreductase [Pandoraea apista]|uniref:3-hydroxy-2-methylbutyryl-CoA dehydrogenase n=1 Tax=Pandoraea apista TaxID=93218 RepID=A0A0G4JHR5_9BURK|nr:SDR family NAD(P)-dependent oxidoreductase [Pandoraea apista]ALS65023.1 3-hydroxyacyl-CoA dehydrogenase [Pandoraea apista]AVF40116.1 KR domain-containing protein [Pandoraea apista]OXS93256.1 3-hydroxyacyl-CoA dehydrogenase [Pandoraea apista]PTD99149.1 KR domain-containing protein [Pandoraea apista]RRJ30624.1 SDR family NAD(P)-dependent oxidoreductase [Pandoraea apista]